MAHEVLIKIVLSAKYKRGMMQIDLIQKANQILIEVKQTGNSIKVIIFGV